MKYLITGGSGLVGSALGRKLANQQIPFRMLVRKSSLKKWDNQNVDITWWQPDLGLIAPKALEGITHIVHLAGENIGESRWTPARKAALLDSRRDSTMTLVNALQNHSVKLEGIFAASAIGYYGHQDAATHCTESAAHGAGFQSEVTQQWEQWTDQLAPFCHRFYQGRIGIVLDAQQGALPKLVLPCRFGTYALGSGHQGMSWIHIDDLVASITHLLEHQPPTGKYNLVSSMPVSNRAMMDSLRREIWGLPGIIAAPGFAMKLILGEMAELVLKGSFVSNSKLLNTGFQPQFDSLAVALKDLVRRGL